MMQLSFPRSFDGGETEDVFRAPEERDALIGLALVPGLGPSRTRLLVSRFGTPRGVWNASRSQLLTVDGVGPQTAEAILTFEPDRAVAVETERAESLGATMLTLWDDAYPERLRHIYDPPLLLWMRGTVVPDDARSLAIVGTRRCTDYGRVQAHRLAQELARRGLTIVSGLAYGIDAEAHKGALDAGGRTIGVLGSGLSNVYPESHASLADRMAERGAVMTEYRFDAEPDPQHFPARNRIVSGMTLGTLVVESRERGGSLITARMALEQNREVFAVPGNVGKTSSLGCNHLIQRGHAKLVLTADDVLDELNLDAVGTADDAEEAPPPDLEGAERVLYDALETTPVHVDALCETTGIPSSDALVHLLSLEFKGLVRQLAGKQFVRA